MDQEIKSKYIIKSTLTEDILTLVHLAKIKNTDKYVYVWQYRRELLNPKLVNKLISFSEKLLKIEHPNILKLIDYAFDGESFYAIYEYHQGLISLGVLLEEKKVLPPELIKKIIMQITFALQELESEKLIHGNLNLFSIYLDQRQNVKVTNAVLTLLVQKANIKKLSIFEEGVFIAPELIQRQEYSIRSDIYSFGIILYLLMTAKLPYPNQQTIEKIRDAYLHKYLQPIKINPSIPENINSIIENSILIEPGLRIGSFNMVLDILEKNKEYFSEFKEFNYNSNLKKEITKAISKKSQKKLIQLLANVVIAIGIIVVSLTGYLTYLNYLTAIPEVEIPNVLGLEKEEAIKILNKSKLESVIAGKYYRPDIPGGYILEARPAVGRNVKQNRIIKLFVSKEVKQIAMPNLIGRTIMQSKAVLEQDDLEIEVDEEVFSYEYPKGIIVGQLPTPNTMYNIGEKVFVAISKGFPVSVEVRETEDKKLVVEITCAVLDEWIPQKIAIVKLSRKHNNTLDTGIYLPGQTKTQSYLFEENSILEVYYNDELAFSQKIYIAQNENKK
ncbi:protein kinase [Candidatus Margulisiibacteriota bacterium]